MNVDVWKPATTNRRQAYRYALSQDCPLTAHLDTATGLYEIESIQVGVFLQGVYCGDCLYMRYGENVDEANANPDWKCPHCRDPTLCNCSQHRTRLGWGPTGSLYRKVTALGKLIPVTRLICFSNTDSYIAPENVSLQNLLMTLTVDMLYIPLYDSAGCATNLYRLLAGIIRVVRVVQASGQWLTISWRHIWQRKIPRHLL